MHTAIAVALVCFCLAFCYFGVSLAQMADEGD
jgi:hypothetical protein